MQTWSIVGVLCQAMRRLNLKHRDGPRLNNKQLQIDAWGPQSHTLIAFKFGDLVGVSRTTVLPKVELACLIQTDNGPQSALWND